MKTPNHSTPLNRMCWQTALLCLGLLLWTSNAVSQSTPPAEAFRVLPELPAGPQITPYLQYQTDVAWKQDAARLASWRRVTTEAALSKLQGELRQKLLSMLGGLPSDRTPLHPRIVGTIPMHGFHIEKLIFESLPGVYVTALVYVPDDGGTTKKHPAILVAAGHATNGKAHYQTLCQRLVLRGYVVIAWDPIGQAERSQFWDSKKSKSHYNLICAEHAVMGNLAYLAGTNLARWEIWDGLRAFDYLLTRRDVDIDRINITGTSGGGFQAMHIAALEPRIKVAAISCYITALPMRIHNRIFKDPDSDPEQDLYGMISNGVDNAGLLLLMYPRPVFVAAAVLDFFPIEGTEKAFREVREFYVRFGHADRIAMAEGYHGHQFSDVNQEKALAFLDHFNRLAKTQGLASAKDLDDASVQCTRTGQVMLDFKDAKPLTEVIREYHVEHKGRTASTVRTLYFGQGYPGIRSWKLAEFAGAAPADSTIAWENVGSSTFGGIVIDRYALHHSNGLILPLLHIHKAGGRSDRWQLRLGKDGKASRKDWPEIEKQVAAGYDIISFDFRGQGETRMPYKAVSEDDPSLASLDFDQAYVNPLSSVLAGYVYNALLTGRPYFLQMIEDSEIAARFAQLKFGTTSLTLVSGSENGLFARAVASTLDGIKLETQPSAETMKWSDLVMQRTEQWPIQFLLPDGAYIN